MILEESVLLIGAGGLGCGAALALAAAGLRHLTVVDDDVVEESNLHRQVLHKHAAIGTPKARSLAATLAQRFVGAEPALGVEGCFGIERGCLPRQGMAFWLGRG